MITSEGKVKQMELSARIVRADGTIEIGRAHV